MTKNAWLLLAVCALSATCGAPKSSDDGADPTDEVGPDTATDADEDPSDDAADDTPATPDDADGDGIADADDNCVDHTNAEQYDVDADGIGDACDADPDVWVQTTEAFDAECTDCTETLREVMPHLGIELVHVSNAAVDDPVAQWVDCVDGFMDCVLAGTGVDACADAATNCPDECLTAYHDRVDPSSSDLDKFRTFGEVLGPGGACMPSDSVSP